MDSGKGAVEERQPKDSTIASAVLDRLLHHAETIVIEGTSYAVLLTLADV